MIFEADISEQVGRKAILEIVCEVERDGTEYDDPCNALPVSGTITFPDKNPEFDEVIDLKPKDLEAWAQEFESELCEAAFEYLPGG